MLTALVCQHEKKINISTARMEHNISLPRYFDHVAGRKSTTDCILVRCFLWLEVKTRNIFLGWTSALQGIQHWGRILFARSKRRLRSNCGNYTEFTVLLTLCFPLQEAKESTLVHRKVSCHKARRNGERGRCESPQPAAFWGSGVEKPY